MDERGARPPLGKRVGDVERVQGEHGRQIRELRDTLNVKDNSRAEVKGWIDSRVELVSLSGVIYLGTLKWIDKYNYGVLEDNRSEATIFHKSGIGAIRRMEE